MTVIYTKNYIFKVKRKITHDVLFTTNLLSLIYKSLIDKIYHVKGSEKLKIVLGYKYPVLELLLN